MKFASVWRRYFLASCLVLFLTAGFSAWAYSNPGKPAGFVNDYAGMLNSQQISDLNAKLTQFSKDSSNEVSVVMIKSLDGDTIENYSNKLFTDWKIGKDKKDNGVLLLISLADHKMRIEPGYGLEGALPDATCNQIITNTMRPAFQANDYYGGINRAVDQIISATKGEYQADSSSATSQSSGKSNINIDTIVGIIIFFFYAINGLWRYLAKSRSWWAGGLFGVAIGLFLALIFFRTLPYLLFLPIGIGVLGLIFDYLVSRVLPKPKPPRRGGGFWFFGGPGGGNSGGGLGGGGFGGFGGGMSGGGGSSGSW